jgi:hypothetical protein
MTIQLEVLLLNCIFLQMLHNKVMIWNNIGTTWEMKIKWKRMQNPIKIFIAEFEEIRF